jgi:hypothetical protein
VAFAPLCSLRSSIHPTIRSRGLLRAVFEIVFHYRENRSNHCNVMNAHGCIVELRWLRAMALASMCLAATQCGGNTERQLAAAAGGSLAVGGHRATGGAASIGGASAAVGGAAANGGSAPAGGNSSSGGSSSGGSSPSITGGALGAGGATGGSPSSAVGGLSPTGGKAASGGLGPAGGSSASGGTRSLASSTTGGAVVTGGSKASGGSSAPGTAGANATGGAQTVGGSNAAGGTLASGGSVTTGGSPTAGGGASAGGASATGGNAATGGTVATGGSAATGGTPPCIEYLSSTAAFTSAATGLTTTLEDFSRLADGSTIDPTTFAVEYGDIFYNHNSVVFESIGVSTQAPGTTSTYIVATGAPPAHISSMIGSYNGYDGIRANFSSPQLAALLDAHGYAGTEGGFSLVVTRSDVTSTVTFSVPPATESFAGARSNCGPIIQSVALLPNTGASTSFGTRYWDLYSLAFAQ